MSRTRHGSKSAHYEFWTARPGNRHGCSGYGAQAKHFTHRRERRAGARLTRAEVEAA
jgi:hypothetical protein